MTWKEAKREMMFAKRNVLEGSYIDQAYDKAIEALSQPEGKKGKWLDRKGNVKIIGYGAYCSCCRKASEDLTNYCGWCGALMNEEEWKEWSE